LRKWRLGVGQGKTGAIIPCRMGCVKRAGWLAVAALGGVVTDDDRGGERWETASELDAE
jgi:hypothetical protein